MSVQDWYVIAIDHEVRLTECGLQLLTDKEEDREPDVLRALCFAAAPKETAALFRSEDSANICLPLAQRLDKRAKIVKFADWRNSC